MKKILLFFTVAFAVLSCGTDVKFSNPGFQAQKDGALFRANSVAAYKSTATGAIRIVANTDYETLTLKASGSSLGNYYFANTNAYNAAIYTYDQDGISLIYKTLSQSGAATVVSYPILAGGSGYSSANNVTTTGGNGSGLKVNIATVDGVIKSIAISSNTGGTGYYPGDVITVNGGNGNAHFVILHVNGSDSNGLVQITSNTGGSISGTFKLNAELISGTVGNELVSFQTGEFYNVPLNSEP